MRTTARCRPGSRGRKGNHNLPFGGDGMAATQAQVNADCLVVVSDGALLLTSHDTGDMERVCTRAIVINHGRLLWDGNISGLRRAYLKAKRQTERGAAGRPAAAAIPITPAVIARLSFSTWSIAMSAEDVALIQDAYFGAARETIARMERSWFWRARQPWARLTGR